MPLAKKYLEDVVLTLRKQKDLTDNALKQVSDENFFLKPGEFSNSIAVIVKHVSGNLHSRWTDFLTTDGEKPWRDRDGEFQIGPADTRHQPYRGVGGRLAGPLRVSGRAEQSAPNWARSTCSGRCSFAARSTPSCRPSTARSPTPPTTSVRSSTSRVS